VDEADDLMGFLIQETLRGRDAASAATQERAVRAAIRLLGRIEDRVALFMELKRVAERFGIPEQVLRDETVKAQAEARASGARPGRGGPGRAAEARPARRAPPKDDLEAKLLEALLAVPAATAQVAARGVGPEAWDDGPARQVAAAVFALARGGEAVEAGEVLGALEDPAARDLASALIGRIDPSKDYVRELEGVDALLVRARERRAQELLRELRQTKDPQAKARLLAEHARLRAEIDGARSRSVAKAR
jgi:DNA primase